MLLINVMTENGGPYSGKFTNYHLGDLGENKVYSDEEVSIWRDVGLDKIATGELCKYENYGDHVAGK